MNTTSQQQVWKQHQRKQLWKRIQRLQIKGTIEGDGWAKQTINMVKDSGANNRFASHSHTNGDSVTACITCKDGSEILITFDFYHFNKQAESYIAS